MTVEEFEQTMLRFKYHEPFEPFVVELLDGRTIEVVHPEVAFHENGGAFLTPDFEFVSFRREEVRAIHPATHGATS